MKTEMFDPSTWPDEGIPEVLLPVAFASMDRHFGWLVGLSKCIVAEIHFYPNSDVRKEIVQTPDTEFLRKYQSARVIIGTGDKAKTESVAKKWTQRSQKPTFTKINFLATEDERTKAPKVLSCFNGLPLDATQPLAFGDCRYHSGVQLVLDHFHHILANGDAKLCHYIVGWHAYALQTYDKVGVALAFCGQPGTGKSTLYYKSTHNSPIFATIYGQTYQGTGGLAEITARFNSTSEAKLLCVVDEVADGEGKKNMDRIKMLADSSETTIEYKHMDAQRMQDKRNSVFLTNHRDAFGTDGATDEITRKMVIAEVSDKYSTMNCHADPLLAQEADSYFTDLNKAMASVETQMHFFWFLKHYPLSDMNWKPFGFPRTTLMQEMLDEANPISSFLTSLRLGECDTDDPDGDDGFRFAPTPTADANVIVQKRFLFTAQLYKCFTTWSVNHMPSADISSLGVFVTKMKKAAEKLPFIAHKHMRNGNGYVINAIADETHTEPLDDSESLSPSFSLGSQLDSVE